MALDSTAPALDALLLGTALEFELSQRDLQVSENRYGLIPEHLRNASSRLRNSLEDSHVYAQGSRAIGTTIVHGASDDRFDLDAILEFRPPPGWTPKMVLDELHKAFQGFPDVRKIERCTRCIQLQFAFMHLDVTPMNPFPPHRPERVGWIFHSPDQGADETFDVNPFGFAEWFKSRVTLPSAQFALQAETVRKRMVLQDIIAKGSTMATAEIDKLPAPVDPIRDAPQVIALKLMKRFLNLRYANREMKRPVSVFLSKVAVEVPLNPNGLTAQLEAYTVELYRRLDAAEKSGRRLEERNPAYQPENFNDRWPKTPEEIRAFRADLKHLYGEIAKAKASELTEIKAIFSALFGERVSDRAIRAYLESISSNGGPATYEHGKGFIAAPALLSAGAKPAAATSKVTGHSFHPGFLD